MNDRAIVGVARSAVVVGGFLAIAGSMVIFRSGELEFWWRSFSPLLSIFSLAFAVFVWVVIPHQPRNAAVWTMAASAFCGVTVAGLAVVVRLVDGDPTVVLERSWVPADASTSVAWTMAVANGASLFGLSIPLAFGLLLFPDGSLPSPRWRGVAWTGAVSVAVFAISHAAWNDPHDDTSAEGLALNLSLLGTFGVMVLALFGLVLRFRSSTGATRQQFKWIVFGSAVCVPALIIPAFLPDTVATDNYDALVVGVTLAAGALALSYGIAVGRYHLYDVEVVISRTVVFVGLAGLIGVVYVGVVVGIGSAFGGSSLRLSVVATALVAVGFEPARARLQRWANRLVYGPKATPYQVLAALTDQMAASEGTPQLLDRLASYLQDGTGASRAIVWLAENGGYRPVATTAGPPIAPLPSADELPDGSVHIELDGEELGALTVEARPGVAFTLTDRRVVESLAGSAALVMHRVRLDEALALKARELEESRRRLLGAQDDERRRLEETLRDGVEHQVAELRERLGHARRDAVTEGSDRTVALIDEMVTDTGRAVTQIRSLARGIYPTLLGRDGLEPALSDLAERCPHDVRASVDLAYRHPRVVEGAVYFCVSEALTNASKYASGPISVAVSNGDAKLRFEITDSGPGFDPTARERGSGLDNMADRLDALGGTLDIVSRPGAATTISGRVPSSVVAPTGSDR